MYDTIVTLKKGEGRTLKAGGAWIYDNEIDTITGSFENGDIVTVHDFDGYFLGYGFINTKSKLTVRMLSRKKSTGGLGLPETGGGYQKLQADIWGSGFPSRYCGGQVFGCVGSGVFGTWH